MSHPHDNLDLTFGVLILVLMEDALRVRGKRQRHRELDVLILVLMEDALRALHPFLFKQVLSSLNPCSNGRCSASNLQETMEVEIKES